MYRLITDDDNNIKRPQNPRTTANAFEIITYTWMLKLFKTGRSRDLMEKDLYSPLNDHTSSLLGNKLEKYWRLELSNAYTMNRKPSLLRALLKGFGAKYMFYGLLLFFDGIVLKLSQPLLIGGLLSYFIPNGSNKTDLRHAYMCAFGLVISMLISMVLNHSTHLEILHYGMKMRISCCSVIFRKALCLSHTALGETTVGQVTNLLSNDVNRFDIALTYIHYLWIGPLQTVVVTYFMWKEIGMSSVFGVSMIIIFIPLQSWLGKQIFKFRMKTAIRTDERGRLMSEIISGIQVIKMYTWEKLFVKLVENARINEIRQVRGSSIIKAISTAFRGTQIRFQLFVSILSYVLLGNSISIQKVFVVTSFYNILQGTMTVYFCSGIVQIAELLVTIKRIKNFLLLEDKNSTLSTLSKSVNDLAKNIELNVYDKNTLINNTDLESHTERMNDFGIDIFNAFAKWTDVQTNYSLENINLTVRPGLLAAVIGPVGSGKSSLIHLILRELPLFKGRISVRGVISYASQEPWLFAGSVRQNILFDSQMDFERYKQVIKVCALERDLEQFPYGDRTIVGEKGVTLSGGQKARINLARAVYKQADIYLLDDPLSAVDSCVGKHLFEKCIKDYLKEKTCLLITHQIQYIANVDQIIILDNGHILAKGSYQELEASVLDIEKLFESSEEKIMSGYIDIIDKNYNNTYLKDSDECISSSIDKIYLVGDQTRQNEVIEVRSVGKISKKVYTSYFCAGGGPCNVFFFFFMYIFTQALTTGGDYWISFWVNQEEYVFRNENSSFSFNDNSTLLSYDTFTLSLDSRQTYIIVYAVLIISLIVAILIRSVIFVSVCTNASLNLHSKMFNTIIKATMYFFNTNSSGRILNRFSNDIGAVDEILPSVLMDCLQMGMRFLGIIFVIGFVNVYLILPTIIVGIILYYIRVFYLPTSRSFKRLEGVTRSPVFAHMNASIQGLTTIRAYEVEQTLSKEFDKYQDLHSSAWYLFISSNEAFGFWMDIVCITYLSIVIFSFLIIRNNAYGGFVGLTITQTMALVGLVQWGIRQWAVLENQMTSVERIIDYSNSPQETNFESSPEKMPLKEWPNSPKIVFQNLSLRYSLDSPYVLKNLNFQIQPMEKIGIVGRTGAGKSSIIGALFRLALNEGKIIIDGIEIHELGLYDLRSKFSIIPQEPVLFSGTIRKNLDPFDEYSDHVLLNALDEVELKVVIENLTEGLNSKITESGTNFSVGQRQLLCLARAIVRNNKILVLDEATANVDQQTDELIQNTIRKKFKTCTVLTIAHRLNTVMESNRVIVLDAGKIVEFDHPYNLLKDKNGFLYSMVNQTGPVNADLLHKIASENFETMEMKSESHINTINNDINYKLKKNE